MKFIENMKQIWQKFKEFWVNTSLYRKLLISGAITVVVVVFAYLIFMSGNKSVYEVLYTDLNSKDAAAIVEVLNEQKIPYRLADEGMTIYVPADVKYTTRLNLSAQNLPQAQAGFELFETSNFGETQSDKRVKYQVAMQGEIGRTIESIAQVKSARVHLVLPEESLFADNQQKTTASIQITCFDGQSLSAKEIEGIKRLVANGVEGLDVNDVVVIDNKGNLISDIDFAAADNSLTEKARVQLALKQEFEREKQKAIQQMLDLSVGPGHSVVQVNADLNFNISEEKTEQYTHDPDGSFIRSEQILSEAGTDVTNSPQSIPGTDTNIPQYAEATTNTGTSTFERSERTRNYEINKTETMTQFAVGSPDYEHFTAAVLVDSRIAERLGTTDEERTRKITGIVAAACGLKYNPNSPDNTIGDSISVAFIEFYSTDTETVVPPGISELVVKYLPFILAAIALLIFIIVLLILKLRKKRATQGLVDAEDANTPGFDQVVGDDIDLKSLYEPVLSEEELEYNRVKAEVEKLTQEDPASAVQVIRAWLMEDQR